MIAFISLNCSGGGRGGKSSDNTPERTGVKILSEELKKYDASPAMSSDGLKLVFISGREETLQAFRYEVDGDGAVRAFDDDFGETIEVAISPDGVYIASIVNSEGSVDIYVTKFDGTGSPSKIDDDNNAVESGLRFSHDSSYLMFNQRSASTSNTGVYVSQITDGVAGAAVRISDANTNEFNIGWKSGESYEVLTSQKQDSGFLSDIVSRSFSTPTSISSESKVYENLKIDFNVPSALSSSQLFFASPNLEGDSELSPISPEGDGEADQTMPVVSAVSKVDLSTLALTTIEGSGFEILSTSTNAAGTLALITSRNIYNCSEKDLTFGATMFLYNVTLQTFSKIYPVAKDEASTISTTVCDNDGETDDRILKAVLSLDSTPESYQIAYVTYQTDDTEVRYFDVQTSGETITPTYLSISNN